MGSKRVCFNEVIVLVLSSALLLASAGAVVADVSLPAVIGDNMVLQRGAKVPIWGWAEPGEQVTVGVSWHTMRWGVTADQQGKWRFGQEHDYHHEYSGRGGLGRLRPIQHADGSPAFS
jgi:hypothetical protein